MGMGLLMRSRQEIALNGRLKISLLSDPAPATTTAGSTSAVDTSGVYLWNSALILSRFLAASATEAPDEGESTTRASGELLALGRLYGVLELGSGLGLCGITAGLLCGKGAVLTDSFEPALHLLRANVQSLEQQPHLLQQVEYPSTAAAVFDVRYLEWTEEDPFTCTPGGALHVGPPLPLPLPLPGPEQNASASSHRPARCAQALEAGRSFGLILASDCLYPELSELPTAEGGGERVAPATMDKDTVACFFLTVRRLLRRPSPEEEEEEEEEKDCIACGTRAGNSNSSSSTSGRRGAREAEGGQRGKLLMAFVPRRGSLMTHHMLETAYKMGFRCTRLHRQNQHEKRQRRSEDASPPPQPPARSKATSASLAARHEKRSSERKEVPVLLLWEDTAGCCVTKSHSHAVGNDECGQREETGEGLDEQRAEEEGWVVEWQRLFPDTAFRWHGRRVRSAVAAAAGGGGGGSFLR